MSVQDTERPRTVLGNASTIYENVENYDDALHLRHKRPLVMRMQHFLDCTCQCGQTRQSIQKALEQRYYGAVPVSRSFPAFKLPENSTSAKTTLHQVQFNEYRGVGAPGRRGQAFGEPGDIYIDETPGKNVLYGKTSTEWKIWPGPLVVMAGLRHPAFPNYLLWCNASDRTPDINWVFEGKVKVNLRGSMHENVSATLKARRERDNAEENRRQDKKTKRQIKRKKPVRQLSVESSHSSSKRRKTRPGTPPSRSCSPVETSDHAVDRPAESSTSSMAMVVDRSNATSLDSRLYSPPNAPKPLSAASNVAASHGFSTDASGSQSRSKVALPPPPTSSSIQQTSAETRRDEMPRPSSEQKIRHRQSGLEKVNTSAPPASDRPTDTSSSSSPSQVPSRPDDGPSSLESHDGSSGFEDQPPGQGYRIIHRYVSAMQSIQALNGPHRLSPTQRRIEEGNLHVLASASEMLSTRPADARRIREAGWNATGWPRRHESSGLESPAVTEPSLSQSSIASSSRSAPPLESVETPPSSVQERVELPPDRGQVLSKSHFDVIFHLKSSMRPPGMICRLCLGQNARILKFPEDTPEETLRTHCNEAHADFCSILLGMKEDELVDIQASLSKQMD